MKNPTLESATTGFSQMLDSIKNQQSLWPSTFASKMPLEVETIISTFRSCLFTQAISKQCTLREITFESTPSQDDVVITKSIITSLSKKMMHLYECNECIPPPNTFTTHYSYNVLSNNDSIVILQNMLFLSKISVTILSLNVDEFNMLSKNINSILEGTDE